MPTNNRAEPLAHFGDGIMHAPPELDIHFAQLRLQSFTYRVPQQREPPVAPLLSAHVRKAKEVERFRFPFSTPLRFWIANGPNSSSRVFSGCSSRWNFRILSLSSVRN